MSLKSWLCVLTLVIASTLATPFACPQLAPSEPAQQPLPDSPGTVQAQQNPPPPDPAQPQLVVVAAETSFAAHGTALPPCPVSAWKPFPKPTAPTPDDLHRTCIDILNPYTRFLDTRVIIPMTPKQKGLLAIHDLTDPFNLATIVATSAFTVATNAYNPYGPAWRGFGKSSGVSLLQDATGEFFGTWAIPSLFSQDPRYHRLPNATIPHRMVHAISHTIITQSDIGTPMPNVATILTYTIGNELSNLYVPGIHSNGPSTLARIGTGLAFDPIDNLITEFLPDVAKRVHIRVIFVQRILNQVATGQPEPN